MFETYKLVGTTTIPCSELEYLENRAIAKRVALDQVGPSSVSTVFLGLNHQYNDKGPPILFETMVFGGPLNEEQVRYSTYDEAMKGHVEMIRKVYQKNRWYWKFLSWFMGWKHHD